MTFLKNQYKQIQKKKLQTNQFGYFELKFEVTFVLCIYITIYSLKQYTL